MLINEEYEIRVKEFENGDLLINEDCLVCNVLCKNQYSKSGFTMMTYTKGEMEEIYNYRMN